jgi:antitoxin component YwqK of YwqJK toxin-antitoxin module
LFLPVQLLLAQDTIIEGVRYQAVFSDTSGSAWTEYMYDQEPHGKYLEYYGTGTLKARGYYQKGAKAGHWMTFHRNGHNESDGIMDKKFGEVGKWYYFFPDGSIKTQVAYRIRFSLFWGWRPQLTGCFRLAFKAHFRRVIPTGPLREYYPSGELRCLVSYNRKGQLDGRSFYYYENGKVQREEHWAKGEEILFREYCRNGALYSIQDFTNPQNDYRLNVEDGSCACDHMETVVPTFTLNYSGWPVYRVKF